MTKVIAEIGWNHMGDMDLAMSMIDSAAESGASYAKFQTWSVERLKPGEWDEDGRREIYVKAELSKNDHKQLIRRCQEKNIDFMSSCFSLPDAMLLSELKVKEVKIPSFEVRNEDLIGYCISNFGHTFISTGTASIDDIENLARLAEGLQDRITVMHCVSAYPCNPEVINLPRINGLKKYFENVGFSDHTEGVSVALFSLQFGPSIIEKHFTTDRNLPGRDNKFGILPNELNYLCNGIRNYRPSTRDQGLGYQDCELKSRLEYSGRFNIV
jgi:N,N'-diacetyllegionaminate synthase